MDQILCAGEYDPLLPLIRVLFLTRQVEHGLTEQTDRILCAGEYDPLLRLIRVLLLAGRTRSDRTDGSNSVRWRV